MASSAHGRLNRGESLLDRQPGPKPSHGRLEITFVEVGIQSRRYLQKVGSSLGVYDVLNFAN